MIGWIAVALSTGLFVVVMAALAWESVAALFCDDQVDGYCADVDQELDAMYGGWRN